MKHVGKMKNNGARVAVVYRTLPGESTSALVVGTNGLGNSYHDALMQLIEEAAGQTANELADVLAVRRFPDGSNMLEYLHNNGHLKKIPTTGILMTPAPQTQIQLDELNQLIADQKGVTVDQLAITEGKEEVKETPKPTQNKWDKAREEKAAKAEAEVQPFELTPAEMRSRADTLYKEAAKLRKDADALDPPKKKAKTETVGA
jgi:hypothetical protein